MLEQIKASAGSGKTYTLTRRFLELLCQLSTEHPKSACNKNWKKESAVFSEILAMTFTNKAAAEMKERVISTLKQIALSDPSVVPLEGCGKFEAKQAAAWLDVILRRYDSLNIRTIDSLLNLLVKISAVNLNIPPDFELSFDDRAFLSPLYDELLDSADQGNASAMELLSDCAACLLSRPDFKGLTPRDGIQKRLLEVLKLMHSKSTLPCTDDRLLHQRWQECLNEILHSLEVLRASIERQGIKPIANAEKFFCKLEEYSFGQALTVSAYASKPSFCDCCPKAQQGLVNDNLEDAYKIFCSIFAENWQKMRLYSSALSILPYARTAMHLFPQIQALQQSSGQISGSLLPGLAAGVLDGSIGISEACCRLGTRLTHLLIDEFQDTSREQWAALEPLVEECLSRGGSLYYVGDVKQAIYSWRGGDSTLFDEVVKNPRLTAIEPGPSLRNLEKNWRSSPAIVRHNNTFFSQLADPAIAEIVAAAMLPEKNPATFVKKAAAMLAKAFTGAAQELPESSKDKAPGFVQIQKLLADSKEDLNRQVFDRLADLFLHDLLPRRNPGDIAVLVRTAAEADFVAGCLLSQGIAVVTEHSFRMKANPLIRRIITLLKFLDYPPDDLNFLSFISGPEIFEILSGLPADSFLEWEAGIAKEQQTGKKQPLFKLFQRDYPEEWALWLEPFYNRSGLMGAYDTVTELFRRFELLKIHPQHDVYLRRFLELVLNAEKQGYTSLSAFLDYWDAEGQEEKIPSPESPDAVRIMTMHKAKGLEFKVVVVPFHRFSSSNETDYVMHDSEGLTLLVQNSDFLGPEYYAKKNIEALEKLYLLYVAWTRAGEELHALIGGTQNDLKNAGIPKAIDLLLSEHFNFSKEGIYTDGIKISIASPEDSMLPPVAEPAPQAPYALQAPDQDWAPMQWLPTLKIFRNPVPEIEYDQRVRGILFHNCLENIYIPDNNTNFMQELPQIIEHGINHTLRTFHLPITHTETARQEISDALQWFLSQPNVPAWLRQGRSEQTIMDENGANFRVDMLVEEETGRFLVLEYKTGTAREEHISQIRNYLNMLERSNGQKARGVLIYLDERYMQEVTA